MSFCILSANTNSSRLVVCVANAFGTLSPPQLLVEWLEMQRLQGINRVVIYNRSLSAESTRLLRQYVEDGARAAEDFHDRPTGIAGDLGKNVILVAVDDEP
jgi:Glycosyltransferase family 92